jgi:DNA-binding NtrC family response regulator
VRVIAATNRDMHRLVAERAFREDLYYRLSVFPIVLPPLRERPADILPLAAHILHDAGRRFGKHIAGFTDEAQALLQAYAWPGNIRELQNVIERAAILCREDRISPAHMHLSVSVSPAVHSSNAPKTLRDLEREAILAALATHKGNRRKVADQLGIGLRTLYTRLRDYGISAESDEES